MPNFLDASAKRPRKRRKMLQQGFRTSPMFFKLGKKNWRSPRSQGSQTLVPHLRNETVWFWKPVTYVRRRRFTLLHSIHVRWKNCLSNLNNHKECGCVESVPEKNVLQLQYTQLYTIRTKRDMNTDPNRRNWTKPGGRKCHVSPTPKDRGSVAWRTRTPTSGHFSSSPSREMLFTCQIGPRLSVETLRNPKESQGIPRNPKESQGIPRNPKEPQGYN